MKPVFADTFFFFAILNRADLLLQRAVTFSRNTRLLRITTDWVITELANGLSKVSDRERFMDLYRHIQLSTLIGFALREEAATFRKIAAGRTTGKILT